MLIRPICDIPNVFIKKRANYGSFCIKHELKDRADRDPTRSRIKSPIYLLFVMLITLHNRVELYRYPKSWHRPASGPNDLTIIVIKYY